MAVASRCETHVMKLTNCPIKGIVGSVSREIALQAISLDIAKRFLFLILFNKASAKGSKGLPLGLPKATS